MNTASLSILIVRLVAFALLVFFGAKLAGGVLALTALPPSAREPAILLVYQREVLVNAIIVCGAFVVIFRAKGMVASAVQTEANHAHGQPAHHYGTMVLIAMRIIGLAVIAFSLQQVVLTFMNVDYIFQYPFPSILIPILYYSFATLPFAFGIYLVFGGRWLVRQVDRRYSGDKCVLCGYDLKGITAAACPECGMQIPPAPAREPAPDSGTHS